ncbi:OmpA family protein [Pedobacter sp. BMA]|uniref:OmpA family protein n=1 Tax=Pedobacter sp. BMA TaxID=1663685 RepID=UPI00064A606C|nr:OmpA family protein [Pedobacter sp. BMA]KLT66689.1 flagellar motor protein MotB [Pedobacter sp. BMA]
MIKYLKLLLITVIFVAVQLSRSHAQYMLKEADAQYQLYNFKKAIDFYEQAYKKKPTLYAAERLGECYAFTGNYTQTESWYAITAGMPDTHPENVLHYARALQQNAKYAEAKQAYRKYKELNKDSAATQNNTWLLSCDSSLIWMQNPTRTIVSNQGKLNSPQSDWGAFLHNNTLTFASDRGNVANGSMSQIPFLVFDGAKRPDKTVYGWTGNAYLKLYSVNSAGNLQLFPVDANTAYHLGPASFTSDGLEMYFTVTKIPQKPVYVSGKLATVNVEIFSSKQNASGKWSAPVPFKFNRVNEYSLGDPFISPDGNSLYFVSNMKGGKGGTDIYLSKKTNAGEWELPVNLMDINTEGNERTPYFYNNYFYFSTDGRIGMGGLDIFESQLIEGKFSAAKNLGYPGNSPQDDFAYIKSGPKSGYLSSNRNGGLGSDDIYRFEEQQVFAFKLSGRVFDKLSRQPLGDAIATLTKTDGRTLKIQTDENGTFRFNLDAISNYNLVADKTGFRSDATKISTVELAASTEIHKDLYLEKIVLDKPIRLENIYYDFDKFNIRPDAAIELNKLVKMMQENPTIWIELGSHTDSRGNDQYNQWLSQSRANAAVKYIVERGIDKNRITAMGYGERRLLNDCANGIKCSAAEHQLNRRTEFKIVKQ